MRHNLDSDIGKLRSSMLGGFHRLMLEALRQREQDVIKYIAILAPALGGYVWLQEKYGSNATVFVVGTFGVIFLLLVGGIYAVALGYNYRYITLQLAKLETTLRTRDFILKGWPRDAKMFGAKYGRWCGPPEVIKVFWMACLFAIAGVTILSAIRVHSLPVEFMYNQSLYINCLSTFVIVPGIWASVLVLCSPIYFGTKILEKCRKEPEWKPFGMAPPGATDE